MKPRALFLSRRSQASLGGIQQHGRSLTSALSHRFEIENMGCGGPLWLTPFLLPSFYFRSLPSQAGVVHCDDAVTALIGRWIGRFSRKRVVATVHGRDVTLPIFWYQWLLKAALRQLDAVVCVSRATAEEVIKRGVDPSRVEVIPNAAESEVPAPPEGDPVAALREATGVDFGGKRILLSLGRPIPRKGFDYFIQEVFPQLPEDCVYVVAGAHRKRPDWIDPILKVLPRSWRGPVEMLLDVDSIHEEVQRASRNHPRIFYFNDISDSLRDLLYCASKLFVMPNRVVPGDMEGFGIVALEAAVRGVPVVATGIEGITDAVIENQNGILVPEGQPQLMASKIINLLDSPDQLAALKAGAARFTREQFSSKKIGDRYEALFLRLLEDQR